LVGCLSIKLVRRSFYTRFPGAIISTFASGIYTGVSSYKEGSSLGESFAAGALTSFFSIPVVGILSDYANDFAKKTLSLKVVEAIWSLVSGTGFNSLSAATTKVITQNNTTITKAPKLQKPNTNIILY